MDMICEFEVTVPAPAGEEKRNAYVYCPEGEGPFPVLYFFDGQNAFWDERAPYGQSWRLADFLQRNRVGMIVATAECDKRNRLSEYSPFPFRISDEVCSSGKGRQFMDWMTGPFKRLIDERFPTRPDRKNTFVMGSSMGGLMAIYALSAYGNVFSRAVSMSAAVWADGKESARLCRELPADAALYFDYGTAELKRYAKYQRPALELVERALKEWGGEYEFYMAPGGHHNEAAWRARLPRAFAFLGYPQAKEGV